MNLAQLPSEIIHRIVKHLAFCDVISLISLPQFQYLETKHATRINQVISPRNDRELQKYQSFIKKGLDLSSYCGSHLNFVIQKINDINILNLSFSLLENCEFNQILNQNPKITKLVLSKCYWLTDDSCNSIPKALVNLQELDIS